MPALKLLDRVMLGALTAWAAISIVPVGSWTGVTNVAYYADTWALWARSFALTALVTALLCLVSRGEVGGWLRAALSAPLRVPPAVLIIALGVGAAVESAAVACWYFAKNPQLIDTWVQYLQAKIFLSGELAAPRPPSIAHFVTLHTVLTDRGWTSQYPPLHPALLAVGMAAGAAWLVTPVLTGLLPPAVYLLATRTGDRRIPPLAATLCLASPFVVAMGGSAMNHVPAAVCVAVGLWTLPDVARGRTWPGLVFGAAGGLLFGFRPLDAAALAAVGASAIAAGAWSARGIRMIAATALGALATLFPTLAFNAVMFGGPLSMGYKQLYGAGLDLGFHAGPWGAALTPARALGLTAVDAHQLNVYLLEWPVPVTALVAAGLWLGRTRVDDGIRVATGYLVALVAALFFYFHRDTLYGPRFLFSAVPAIVVLLAAATVRLADTRRRLPWRGLRSGDVALTAVVVTAVLAIAFLAPRRIASYSAAGSTLALHPDDDAARAGLSRAVVVVPDSWGTRLIARMWAADVPMAESDRFYHAFDACTLDGLLSSAEAGGVRGPALTARLRAAMANADPGRPVPGVTRDPNLRLPVDGRLAGGCADEIARDQRGTLQYAALAYLNAPSLDGNVVWAREMGRGDDVLRRLYPDRTIYRYTPGPSGAATFTPVALP